MSAELIKALRDEAYAIRSTRHGHAMDADLMDQAATALATLSETGDNKAAVEHAALTFFVAMAFGDGYFDDDPIKERVRAWLLKQNIREDITIANAIEGVLDHG